MSNHSTNPSINSDQQKSGEDFLPPFDESMTARDKQKLQDWENAQRTNASNTQNSES